MLCYNLPICSQDIYTIRQLAQNIYLLEGFTSYKNTEIDSVVIKAEGSENQEDIQFSYDVMNMVDKEVTALQLKPEEKTAILRFLTHPARPRRYYPSEREARRQIRQDLNQKSGWVKMRFRKLTDLNNARSTRVGDLPEDSDSRFIKLSRIIRALKSKAGLTMLGKIIAVDFFLNNRDRFRLPIETQGGSEFEDMSPTYTSKTLVNDGNIFIAFWKNQRGAPIGLDMFNAGNSAILVPTSDPNDLFDQKNLEEGREWNECSNWDPWLGVAFTNHGNILNQFVKDAIEDLEVLTGPREWSTEEGVPKSSRRLGNRKNAERRLFNGILAGGDILKDRWTNWLKNANPQDPDPKVRALQKGIKQRLCALGWWDENCPDPENASNQHPESVT